MQWTRHLNRVFISSVTPISNFTFKTLLTIGSWVSFTGILRGRAGGT